MTRQHRKHAEAGFTLIEVLVAVIVLTLGLLGLASLQNVGVRGSHNAYLYSQATIQAYDMIDRMRANRGEALAGNYNLAIADTVPGVATVTAADVTDWLLGVALELPAGDGSVALNAGVVTVTVQWTNPTGTDEGNRNETVAVQTQL
jgi:type IV pilus assembly protein PilV